MHVGGDAHGAAGAGVAAVGGHDQAGRQGLSAGQGQAGRLGVGLDGRDLLAAQQLGRVPRAVAHGGLERGAADVVVGNQEAQLGFRAEVVADAHARLRPAHAAVEHQRVLQRRDVLVAEPWPQAQLAQQLGAVLGQRDLAAVKSGFLQRFEGALFDQGGAQAAAAQRPGQAQAGRPGAHDEEVVFHGAAAYVCATATGLTQVNGHKKAPANRGCEG